MFSVLGGILSNSLSDCASGHWDCGRANMHLHRWIFPVNRLGLWIDFVDNKHIGILEYFFFNNWRIELWKFNRKSFSKICDKIILKHFTFSIWAFYLSPAPKSIILINVDCERFIFIIMELWNPCTYNMIKTKLKIKAHCRNQNLVWHFEIASY